MTHSLMNLNSFTTKNPSSYVKPKFLIIELSGFHDWIDRIQDTVQYDLNIDDLMSFFTLHFTQHSDAIMSLDYGLMEIHTENYLPCMAEQSALVLNECRKLGIRLLNYFEDLGCFQDNRLDYTFAKIIDKDTFMFWRPDKDDI